MHSLPLICFFQYISFSLCLCFSSSTVLSHCASVFIPVHVLSHRCRDNRSRHCNCYCHSARPGQWPTLSLVTHCSYIIGVCVTSVSSRLVLGYRRDEAFVTQDFRRHGLASQPSVGTTNLLSINHGSK